MQPNHHKSTRYARRSLIQTILLTSSIGVLVSGCSFLTGSSIDEIETKSNPEPTVPLDIPSPPPVNLESPNWVVLTPENVDTVMSDLKNSGRKQVMFAITPSQYERLSLDFSEIRKYINNQRSILIRYQDYYENPDESENDDSPRSD